MSGKANRQLSFADIQVASRLNEKHFMPRTDPGIDWERISSKLEVLYDPKKGRSSFPPLVMLKTLLLQQWYNLSGPEAKSASTLPPYQHNEPQKDAQISSCLEYMGGSGISDTQNHFLLCPHPNTNYQNLP